MLFRSRPSCSPSPHPLCSLSQPLPHSPTSHTPPGSRRSCRGGVGAPLRAARPPPPCRRCGLSPVTPPPPSCCPRPPPPTPSLAADDRRRQVPPRPSPFAPAPSLCRGGEDGRGPSDSRSTAEVVSRPVLRKLKSAKSWTVLLWYFVCMHPMLDSLIQN